MNDGGPAFACDIYEPRGVGIPAGVRHYPGMSLRDWLAGQAIIGLMAFPLMTAAEPHERIRSIPELVRHSFEVADAMLKEREKQT